MHGNEFRVVLYYVVSQIYRDQIRSLQCQHSREDLIGLSAQPQIRI